MKTNLIGMDEVGTGSLVGSFLVGGVRAHNNWRIDGLNDSKQLTDKQRRIINEKLLVLAESGEIVIAYTERTNIEIDELGLYPTLKSAYKEVAEKLYQVDTSIIIDGNMNFSGYLDGYDYKTIVKADTKVPHCMAASIICKVSRDDYMIGLSKNYPEYEKYGWQTNMGYGSQKHLDAIKKYGYSELHRLSYKLK